MNYLQTFKDKCSINKFLYDTSFYIVSQQQGCSESETDREFCSDSVDSVKYFVSEVVGDNEGQERCRIGHLRVEVKSQ
jgi:hypothetical protein